MISPSKDLNVNTPLNVPTFNIGTGTPSRKVPRSIQRQRSSVKAKVSTNAHMRNQARPPTPEHRTIKPSIPANFTSPETIARDSRTVCAYEATATDCARGIHYLRDYNPLALKVDEEHILMSYFRSDGD